jgi:hypothetical protein
MLLRQEDHFNPKESIMKINSKFNTLLISIMAICLHCTAAEATIADAPKYETAFTAAMTKYKLGQWPAAYGRFVALADQGHPEAARIALIMLRHGVTMYGSDWGASQPQIDQWTKLAFQPMEPLHVASDE